MLNVPQSLKPLVIVAILGGAVSMSPVMAALVAWDSITTSTTEGTPTIDPNNGYLYENDVTVVTSFTAGGNTYEPLIEYPVGDFDLKANPVATRVWYERNNIPSNGNDTGYTGNALVDLADMFDTPLRINYGSDDTFNRTLEALRFTGTTGVQLNDPLALTDAGVSIIERGANDNNFDIRLVMSVDGAGNALTFSPEVTIVGGDPFGGGVANVPHALWDSATNDGDGPFDDPDDIDRTQNIGGLLLTFDQFGISVGDRVYGYEISAAASGSRTGLDLLPSGAAFRRDTLPDAALTIVPSPEPGNGFLVLSMVLGISALMHRQRRRRKTG